MFARSDGSRYARFYYAYDSDPTRLTSYLNQISRVGTPLFAVLSGFLLYNQTLNKKFSIPKFLKSRFVKIISPFVFWSIFYLFYNSIMGRYTFPDFSSSDGMASFLYMFLTGRSQSHLYFIILVIQFYVLFLFIKKLLDFKKIILLTVISFYINYILITNKFEFANIYMEQFINSRSFLLQWIYYFMLGILLVKLWPLIQKFLMINKNSRYTLILGAIVLALLIFDHHSHQKLIASNRNILNMLSVPITFIVLVSVYYNLLMINSGIVKMLIKIGNMSMGIYLIHPFIIYLYRDYAPYDVTAHPLLVIPYFAIVIIICIAVLKLLSLLPFNQYIITLVKTDEKNIDFNINQTHN